MSMEFIDKKKILEAIEKDREFRYALMGLLGYKEILDRIVELEERVVRLEERFAKLEERIVELEERIARLEERFAKLEERIVELEERIARLEERFAKLEERFAQLEERVVKLEERVIKLEERFAKLEERVLRVEEELRETRRVLIVISHRFGVLSEAGFRNAMKYVLQEVFGIAVVEKRSIVDEEGFVYGYRTTVDIDVVIRDREHIVVETKSRVSPSDVATLSRIGKLYEKTTGVKPKLVIIGGFIDSKAYDTASKLGVEIKPVFREE